MIIEYTFVIFKFNMKKVNKKRYTNLALLLLIPSCTIPEGIKTTLVPSSSISPKLSDTIAPLVKKSVKKVEISNSSINIQVNRTYDLTSKVVLGNDEISTDVGWISSDESIVSVSNLGRINALKVGKAKVKAISLIDNTKFSECLITVGADEKEIPIVEITNKGKKLDNVEKLKIGENLLLNAIVKYPNGNFDNDISWSSSDKQIASISSNGMMLTSNKGFVTITATSNKNPSVRSSETFQIEEQIVFNSNSPSPDLLPTSISTSLPITINSIEILALNTTKPIVGESVTLSAIVTMSDNSKNSTQDIIWSSSDKTIATVDNTGKVTTLNAGNVIITATIDGKSNSINLNAILKSVSSLSLHKVLQHDGFIYKTEFNEDGTRLATSESVFSDGYIINIVLWDIISGSKIKKIHVSSGKWEPVRSLAFSDNGNFIYSGREKGEIKVWDTNSSTLVKTLTGEDSTVTSLSIGKGNILASGFENGKIVLWDLNNYTQIKTIPVRSSSVESLRFSSDGKLLACAPKDGNILILNVESGALVKSLIGGEGLTSLKFKQNNLYLVASSYKNSFDSNLFTVWDINTGAVVNDLQVNISNKLLSFNSDFNLLVSDPNDSLNFYSVELWKYVL